MGTSKGYGGPTSGLVPSWADDAAGAAAPAAAASPGLAPTGGSLSGARSDFSRFAATGDGRALGRAISKYVQQGTGGAGSAALRMGTSRAVGSQLLDLVRDADQRGPVVALGDRLDLPGLAETPAADALLALVEVVCPPGGPVDEAIARQAMLEAVADLGGEGLRVGDLTADQLVDFYLDFIARSVEGRILADIGRRGIELPRDPRAVRKIEQQVREYIVGCTRGHLRDQVTRGVGTAGAGVRTAETDAIYEAAFGLLVAAAEATR